MIRAWLENADEVIARFDGFPETLRSELERTVKKLTMDLAKKAKDEKLSGQVLNRKTGKLSRSITPSFEFDAGSTFGIVGTNLSYGRAWELGFGRAIGAGARGGPGARGGITLMLASAKARYYRDHPPGRRTYAPRSFLRSALQEMAQEIRSQINQTVRDTTKGFFS
jgi:phage gpG-like protein